LLLEAAFGLDENFGLMDNGPVHPTSKDTIVELRIGGAKGAQTIFPGSTHETGEPIDWDENGDPASVDGDELRQCVRALAAYSLIVRHWPAAGARHDAARMIGGFLSRAGKPSAEIKYIAEAIAKAASDEEWRDRRTAAEDAAVANHKGKKAYGLNAMREMFGTEVANKMAEWLDYQGGNEQEAAETVTDQERDKATPLLQSSAAFTENFVPPDYLIDSILQRRFIYWRGATGDLVLRCGPGAALLVLAPRRASVSVVIGPT
jgi:hypothetical protein